MRKSAVFSVLLICGVLAPAIPAQAVTNPFMDVPLNHWAYDAIGQLAARGVLSGYPDGTYRGKQPATRYEMASALARALANVDMTKADKRDVEMLKKLVVEFRDELDALGVRVDRLDKRVAVVEDRLGGWKISGTLRLDMEYWKDGTLNDGDSYLARARLEIERWFGENEEMHFFARIDDDSENNYSPNGSSLYFDKFYVEVPTWWDTKMTIGRFAPDFEVDYRFALPGATDMGNDSYLTDRTVDGLMVQKSTGLGTFSFYAAHPDNLPAWGVDGDSSISVWELYAVAQLRFNEQWGLDIGGQAFIGDDRSTFDTSYSDPNYATGAQYRLDNLWTLYGGLSFGFTQSIALKGIYYYQNNSSEYNADPGLYAWEDSRYDGSSGAWKVMLDVKQDLLKFTSLWLEYGQLEQGFYLPYGNVALTLRDTDRWNSKDGGAGFTPGDTSIWRVGAVQRWNDKWSTWGYAAQHTIDGVGVNGSGYSDDAKLLQWGLGAEYLYNPNVTFALNYVYADWNDDAERAGYQDEQRVQFRTQVTF